MASSRSAETIGWRPPSMSMIERRRWPKPTPGAVHTPLPSGPRWARVSAMARMRAGSTGLGTSGWKRPAMPHVSARPGQAGGGVGKWGYGACRAKECVYRRAGAPLPRRLLRGDQHGDCALGAAEEAGLHRRELHLRRAAGENRADAIEARHLTYRPVGEDALRLAGGRRRGVGGPGPGAARLGGALPEADQLSRRLLAGIEDEPEIHLMAARVAVAGGGDAVGTGEMRRPGPAGVGGDALPARHLRQCDCHRDRRGPGGGDGARPQRPGGGEGEGGTGGREKLRARSATRAGRLEVGGVEPGVARLAVEEGPCGAHHDGDDDREEDPAVED